MSERFAGGRIEIEKQEQTPTIIAHSHDTAWLLGAVIGGGRASQGGLSITVKSPEVKQKFKDVGSRLIGVNPRVSQREEGGNEQVSFFKKAYVEALGDLHREEWPETLDRDHQWLLEDEGFIWKFIEGLIDTRGRITNQGKRKVMSFSVTSNKVADKLKDLFVRVGIERTTLIGSASGREGIQGIGIYNKADLKVIAENVESVDPEKQAILDQFKRFTDKTERKQINPADVLAEWRRLTLLFRRIPTSSEVQRLKREGRTKYSTGVYIKTFGLDTDTQTTTWKNATKNLTELVPPPPEASEEIQVFPPKPLTKKDKLLAFVDAQIASVRSGGKPTVHSDQELADRFNLHVQAARLYLREAGLAADWRTIRDMRQ